MATPNSSLDGWPHQESLREPLPKTLPGGRSWPRISIVTPSFNQGAFLEETILSVARQGYPDVEHIVIDGGSTDGTLAVVERHRDRLAHFVSEPDRGQAHAINKGFARSTGEILTWLNSDDLLAPGALAAVALAFDTSGADLVAGMASLFSADRFLEHHLTSCADGPLPLGDLLDLEGCWLAGQFFYQPEVMFSRSIWERAGGAVNEELFYSMDYDLWVRFAAAGARLHVVGRPVARYRVHAHQKTFVAESFLEELRGCRTRHALLHPEIPVASREPAPPPRGIDIVMLNDHGFHYGAGNAHQRIATSLALAGHVVRALSFAERPPHAPVALPSSDAVLDSIAAQDVDLVLLGNLHSVEASPELLSKVARRYPTQIVLHDLWWLTGRCAFPEACEKYLTGCDESCPTPHEYPRLEPQAIRPAWNDKRALLSEKPGPELLAYSDWTADLAADTLAAWQLDRHRVGRISLGFPLESLAPVDKRAARNALDLPEHGFIVLLPGDPHDRRKQVPEAIEALRQLDLPDLTVISLGYQRENESFPLADFRRLGYSTDPAWLARVYSAADIMVSPSRNETLGQVFIEAIACGTPVVGYRSSGVSSAIRHEVTGLLLDPASPGALAAGIRQLYDDPGLRRSMARWGRIHVESEFSFHAAYQRIFCAWRRLGTLERLSLPPKIAFRVAAVESPALHVIASSTQSAAGVIQEPLGIYTANFEEGIDFRRPGRPSFTSRYVGISFPEPWGRWTEGPRAEIHFRRPLPRRCRIEIAAGAFAENVHYSIRVWAGAASTELRITLDPTLEASLSPDSAPSPPDETPGLPLHVVELRTSGRENVLAFEIPRPRQPARVYPGRSNDSRFLGIALQHLRVVEVGGFPSLLHRAMERLRKSAMPAATP